ncbi:hypothetical protein [Arthrobacter sp. SO3]|uniref:hypothetical protein n=1 Tax=Arthrobacter sp. SO3 TaxID=1897057 RepID=UPI001CFFCA85|nr:hypothetical protein [Arthrobacter sp. SO3]MCB5294333.1 hypothetical protein [Arthrobacter sp. SO3]
MGLFSRRREEQAARDRDGAADAEMWREWVEGIANQMPDHGMLTVEVAAQLEALPLRETSSEHEATLNYYTARHFTSQYAARLSRKYILESEEARQAGDQEARDTQLRRCEYMQEVSARLAV